MKILDIRSRQILDSRGNPTVETDVITKYGVSRASVPSGASTGKHEAVELRDNTFAYGGQSVMTAVKNVLSLRKKIVDKDWIQEDFDNYLIAQDGTPNKSALGANALLSLSMAFCKASARGTPVYSTIAALHQTKKLVLPVPAFNIINGGKHAGNDLDVQEFMILPTKAKKFSEALQIGSEIYHELKKILATKYGKLATNVGDEGGFAPPVHLIDEPLDHLMTAIEECGYSSKVRIGMDVAASTFYRNGKYYLEGSQLSTTDLLERYEDLVKRYPICSIEDPFHEDDFSAFSHMTKKLGKKIQIVGDDLLCTNQSRIQTALVSGAVNCLLLKVNQIGTITEALDAATLVRKHDWNIMVSHRSGETTDSFIADLAVGIASGQIKSGAPCRGERVEKYNQLLRIEEELGSKAKYGGVL